MVDYSKWDNIELSDDSDTLPPSQANKASLKHTRQRRVHNQRRERHHRVRALQCEETVNNALLRRLEAVIAMLRDRPPAAQTCQGMLFLALAQTALVIPAQDLLPHHHTETPNDGTLAQAYSSMMRAIAADMSASLGTAAATPDKDWPAAIAGAAGAHCERIRARASDLEQQLQHHGSGKITSESYRVGSESSHVSKARAVSSAPATGHSSSSGTPPSSLALQFAQIAPADYRASRAFICSHRQLLHHDSMRVIIARAHSLAAAGRDALSWQHVHQALVLQWCRLLGDDGVAMFFCRIASRREARESFLKEVSDRFRQIRDASHKEQRARARQHQ